MECKKALASEEVQNDLQKAHDWLRKYGSAKASSKVAGREALEGLVGLRIVSKEGGGRGMVASLVKVASETDFASRSEVFTGFVQGVADAAVATDSEGEGPKDVSNFLSSAKDKHGMLLSEILNDAILSIRENIQIDSVFIMKTSNPHSLLGGYVHGRAPNSSCGTAAAVVEVASLKGRLALDEEEKIKWEDAAKKLAMHVVAARPLYLNPESVPENVVAKEKDILTEKVSSKVVED